MPRPARLVGALAFPLLTLRLAAQDTAAAPAPPPEPGAVVRITFADPSAVRLRNTLFVRPQAPVTGRLVALDSAAVTVALPQTGQLTLPAVAVRRLDVQRGRGGCTRNPVTRLGCAALGAGVGAFAAYGVGSLTVGWTPGMLAAGGAAGAVASARFGRRGWAPVRGWPAR